MEKAQQIYQRWRRTLHNEEWVTSKLETDKCIILAGGFNIPVSIIDRSHKQKISKDIEIFTTNQLNLIFI